LVFSWLGLCYGDLSTVQIAFELGLGVCQAQISCFVPGTPVGLADQPTRKIAGRAFIIVKVLPAVL
jgi:hypothetical protein